MSILSNTNRWISVEAKVHKRNRIAVLLDMALNYIVYGVFPQEYVHYDFFKKNIRDKNTFFTVKQYRKCRAKLSDPHYEHAIFMDKYIFSRVFKEMYGREAILISTSTDEEIEAFLKKNHHFVYKSLTVDEGQGVKVFEEPDSKDINHVIKELRSMPDGIIDEWLIQSDEMSCFYSNSVNCIRVYTFIRGGRVELLDAKVTFGVSGNIANATLNNCIFALVDPNTGVILSDLADYDMNLYIQHPITGFTAKGTQLPLWPEVKLLVMQAARVVPQVAYVGWDVAITESGPVLIEGNHYGGVGGNQFCLLTRRKTGTKEKWFRE